jgi:hypothetical protein
MLESSVDLLNGLFLVAMILLTAVCIVGSIIAALRAVNRGSTTSGSIQGNFVDDMGTRSGGLSDTKAIINKATQTQLEVSAPEDSRSCISPQTPAVGTFSIGTYRS